MRRPRRACRSTSGRPRCLSTACSAGRSSARVLRGWRRSSLRPTGCSFSIDWAVFRLDGETWRLAFHWGNGILRMQSVPRLGRGADIQTTQGYPRNSDPLCFPSRMRSAVWHWNGSTFVAGPWTVTETKAKTVYYRHLRSPNGNIACEFGGGGIAGVECVTVKPARASSPSTIRGAGPGGSTSAAGTAKAPAPAPACSASKSSPTEAGSPQLRCFSTASRRPAPAWAPEPPARPRAQGSPAGSARGSAF